MIRLWITYDPLHRPQGVFARGTKRGKNGKSRWFRLGALCVSVQRVAPKVDEFTATVAESMRRIEEVAQRD